MSPNNGCYEQRQSSSIEDDKDYCISAIIFGGAEGAHWGVMIYKEGLPTGTFHHMREDKDNGNPNLVYRREEGRLVNDSQLNGRVIIQRINSHDAWKASAVLDQYGLDEPTNLCQVWALGGLQRLEEDNLVPKGTHEFWLGNRRRKAVDIKKRVEESDRGEWVSGPAEEEWLRWQEERKSKHVDASALEEGSERRPAQVGRLDMSKFTGIL